MSPSVSAADSTVRAGAGWREQVAVGDYPASLLLLALTAALLPAYVVRWHVAFYPTTLLEASTVATVAAFAVESWRQQVLPAWRSALAWPAALFLLAGAISIAVSPDHRAAVGLFRAYIVEPIALFVVVGNVVRSPLSLRLVLAGLCLGGLVAGAANFVVVAEAARHHTLNVAIAPPVVIYQTPNAVALFLVPLIAVGAAVTLFGSGRERVAAGIFVVAATLFTISSFSRGGYAALAAVALVLAAIHPARRWLLPSLVVAGALVSRVPPVASRLGHEIDLADPNNSLAERIRLWGATLRMMRAGAHPLFGTGLSGFKQTIGPYRGNYSENLMYPHNLVLNFWTETGLLGAVAFIWILVAGAIVASRGWKRGLQAWRPYHLGVALALLAVVIHGLVDVPYWKNDLSMEFWILLGLTWGGSFAAADR